MSDQHAGKTVFRAYAPEQDRDALARLWREVGWLEKKEYEQAMIAVLASGRAWVAEANDAAECAINIVPGTLRFLAEDLPVACVAGVTTGRVARQQGLASHLLARALAAEVDEGATMAFLGAFDQGYYNRLGFGNGSYDHWCTFDPADLTVPVRPRVPVRLSVEDWEDIHRCRFLRWRGHGSCSIVSPDLTRADMLWSDNCFGLGYRDEGGTLTHHFWCSTRAVENGPYLVRWMAYRSREEFLELLGLLRSLGDQVHSVTMWEPPEVQLQDLLRKPFKARRITRHSPHENRMTASAYWQGRILDLAGCMQQTHIPGDTVRFNLVLRDPIDRLGDERSSWRGIGGEYVISLGPLSEAAPGRDASLPTLTASVGAFTRMWLGVRPATGLSWTDELAGPSDLLTRLDGFLRLPAPQLGWDF